MVKALIAILLIGCADAINKRARQAGIPIGRYLLVQGPVFSAVTLIVALGSTGLKLSGSDLFYSLIGGALSFAAFVVMLRGLSRGLASTNYAIFRLSFVFSSGAAIVLFREGVSPGKIVGIVLAVGAIVLFSGRPGGMAPAAVAAMFINACFQLFLKAVAGAVGSTASLFFLMSLVFLILTLGYNLAFVRGRLEPRVLRYALPNGVLMAIGTLFVLGALERGEASRVLPVVQLSFIITAAAAVMFLGEKLTRFHLAGIISAVLAIGLLALV